MTIKDWSTTPANNNSAPPNGAPDTMGFDDVNDVVRQIMADVKTQFDNGMWYDHGITQTYATTTTFTLASDETATYIAGRRLKVTRPGGVDYGTVVSSSWASPTCTVTVYMDGGINLNSGFTLIEVNIDDTNHRMANSYRDLIIDETNGSSTILSAGTPSTGAWVSFGNTSSGATHTNASIDTIPSFVKAALIYTSITFRASTAAASGVELSARKQGATFGPSSFYVGQMQESNPATGADAVFATTFTVPVDANVGFELYIALTNCALQSADVYLAGWYS